jgi:LacI family transcriptional regulator
LLNRGYKRIGVLAGPLRSTSGRKRLQGYRSAMQRAGRTWLDGWIEHCTPSVKGGLDAAITLLTTHPELDALLCYNDLVAVGALQAAANLGRVVPDDIAITGYDDIPLSALVTPSLTTCHVPVQEMGSQAMRLLLDRIGGCNHGCEETMLKPELVMRSSTAAQKDLT